MYRLPAILIAVVLPLIATGCSSDKGPEAFSTGWLGPLGAMKPVSGAEPGRIFVSDAGAAVNAVYLLPVEIIVAPGSTLSTIDPGDIDAMRRMLDDAVRKSLSGSLRLADRPAPDTPNFRAALTQLRIGDTGKFSGVSARANLRFDFGNARIETELRDGASNLRWAATVTGPPAPNVAKDLRDTWSEIPLRFSALAGRMSSQIETALRTLANAKPAAAPAGK